MSALTAPVVGYETEKLAGLWDRAIGQYRALSPVSQKLVAGGLAAPVAMLTGGLGAAGIGALTGVGGLTASGLGLAGGLGAGLGGYGLASAAGALTSLARNPIGRAAGATAGIAHGLPGLIANRGAQGYRYLAPRVQQAGKDLVTGIKGLPDRYRMHQFKMQQDALALEKKRQELLRSRGLWAHARDSIESKIDELVMGARARFGKTSEWVLDAPVFEKEAISGTIARMFPRAAASFPGFSQPIKSIVNAGKAVITKPLSTFSRLHPVVGARYALPAAVRDAGSSLLNFGKTTALDSPGAFVGGVDVLGGGLADLYGHASALAPKVRGAIASGAGKAWNAAGNAAQAVASGAGKAWNAAGNAAGAAGRKLTSAYNVVSGGVARAANAAKNTAGRALSAAGSGVRNLGNSVRSEFASYRALGDAAHAGNVAEQSLRNAMSPAVQGRNFLQRGWNRAADLLRPQVRASTLPRTMVEGRTLSDVQRAVGPTTSAEALATQQKFLTDFGQTGGRALKPGMGSEITMDLGARLGPNGKLLSSGQLQDVQAGVSSAVQNMRMSGVGVTTKTMDDFLARTPGQPIDDFVTQTLGVQAGTPAHTAAVKGFQQVEKSLAGARSHADTLANRVDITGRRWGGLRQSRLDSEIDSVVSKLNKQNLPVEQQQLREQLLQRANSLRANGDFAGQQQLLAELKAIRTNKGQLSVDAAKDQLLKVTGGGGNKTKALTDTRRALGIDDLGASLTQGKLTPIQDKVLAEAAATNPALNANYSTMNNAASEISNLENQIASLRSGKGAAGRNAPQIQQLQAQIAQVRQGAVQARQNILNEIQANPQMFDAAVAREAEPLLAASRADDLARIGAPTRRIDKAEAVANKARGKALERTEASALKAIEKKILNQGHDFNEKELEALGDYARLKGLSTDELLEQAGRANGIDDFVSNLGSSYQSALGRMRGLHAPPGSTGAAPGTSPLAPPTSPAPGVPSGAAAMTAPTMPSWMPQFMQNSPQAALATGLGGGMLLSNAMN